MEGPDVGADPTPEQIVRCAEHGLRRALAVVSELNEFISTNIKSRDEKILDLTIKLRRSEDGTLRGVIDSLHKVLARQSLELRTAMRSLIKISNTYKSDYSDAGRISRQALKQIGGPND